MYKSIDVEIHKNNELYLYFKEMCILSKNLYNTGNFYIRNTMTALAKNPKERNDHENEVFSIVEENIKYFNSTRMKTIEKKLFDILNTEQNESKRQEAKNKLKEEFKKLHRKDNMPTKENWFLGYNLLEGILKFSKNKDYEALPAQVNQAVLKILIQNWKSYFASLKDFKKNSSKYLGKPALPGYKEKMMITTFTNINCKFIEENGKYYLRFPKTKAKLFITKEIVDKGKLMQVSVQPFYGTFKVFLVFKDTTQEITIEKEPKRIFGLDLGVNNFVAISNNIGITPIVVKGGFIKSYNQYYNKKKAKLTSILDKNKEERTSNQLNDLARYRINFFKDIFYKIGHYIIKEAKANNIDTIVIGHSNLWKQETNMKKDNNQNFTSIPFNKFINIMKWLCSINHINCIIREESYTSKASFLDNDFIPTYEKGKEVNYKFSGKREKRGLYVSKEGIKFNADINGASNIIRKAINSAFDKVNDFSYIANTIKMLNYKDFYPISIPNKMG